MDKEVLRQLLIWRMCSDPWPGGDCDKIDEWLNAQSTHYGFSDWMDMYHQWV